MTELKNKILSSKNIIITTHKSPDGDAIGSSLGLYHFLKKFDLNVTIIVPDSFPSFLNWMEGTSEIVIHEKNEAFSTRLIESSDLAFSLDYNGLNRIGEMGKILGNSKSYKILIDHHQNPESFADFSFVDTDCSSTSQLIYEFIEKLGETSKISKNIGECLYCGIMTDTGSFKYPSTTDRTHEIAASFIKKGIDVSKIHNEVYDTNSEDRLRLIGFALTEKMKVFHELGVAHIVLSQEELKRFNFKKGDTEGLVNYPLSINGIKFSALITEKENEISLSFRSKDDVYVNEFASKYFNGGGHIYAAGGRETTTLTETIDKLEKLLKIK